MLHILLADYSNRRHAQDILTLLNLYALDPMGGGKALHKDVNDCLIQELAKRPYALTVIA